MKEPDVMKELHKIRERMSKLSEDEFNIRLVKAREKYKEWIEE
jgi:hypothetical protein